MRTLVLVTIIGAVLCLASVAGADPDLQTLEQGCAGTIADYTIDQRLYACNQLIDAHGTKDRDLANLLLTRSAVFNLKDEPAAAGADIDSALAIAPDRANAADILAVKYIDGGRYDVALAYLDRAHRAAPGSYSILYHRALAQYDLHQWNLAEKDAEAAQGLRPDEAAVLGLLADIRAASGNVDGALDLLDRLVAENPGSEDYRNTRCYVRAVANRELDKALADCNAALKIDPQSPHILDSRGFVYLRMGRYEEAIADYTAAITLADRPSPLSFYGRGLAEQQTRATMSARADISAAEALSPGIDKTFNTPAMLAE